MAGFTNDYSTTTDHISTRNILETKGLVDYKEAIEMAYQILLKQLCKPVEEVSSTIDKLKAANSGTAPGQAIHNRYRISLDLGEQRDFIVLTLVNAKRHEFSRARFLEKRRIKNDLIAYYKPMGLFVKPPQKTPDTNVWVIDLLFRNGDMARVDEGLLPETLPVPLPELMSSDIPQEEEVIVDYVEEEVSNAAQDDNV
tara:strand:- start:3906 stop:4499 length:594 start_codon:yes stop_codon:yes gene_type:complete